MGRHPTGRVPNQPLRIISDRHRDIMRRLIVGETQRQIAHDLGMSEGRLSVICNSPLFKRELAKLQSEVKEKFVDHTAETAERINKLQPAAMHILEEILVKDKDGNNDRIPLRLKKDTALDVLELAGSGKKPKTEDATGDLVKLIAEGFKVAQSARQLNGNVEHNITPPVVDIEAKESEDIPVASDAVM